MFVPGESLQHSSFLHHLSNIRSPGLHGKSPWAVPVLLCWRRGGSKAGLGSDQWRPAASPITPYLADVDSSYVVQSSVLPSKYR